MSDRGQSAAAMVRGCMVHWRPQAYVRLIVIMLIMCKQFNQIISESYLNFEFRNSNPEIKLDSLGFTQKTKIRIFSINYKASP